MRHHSKALKKLIAIALVLLASGAYSQNIMLIDPQGDYTFGNGTTPPSPAAQQFFNIKKDFTSYSGLNRAIVSVTSTVPLGDSTVTQGTQGMKIRIVEPVGIAAAQSNNMFGLFVRLEPRVNRLSDGKTDRTGVLVENKSPNQSSATDAFYISHDSSFGTNKEWETGFKMDGNAFLAFGAQGYYTNGLDFVSGSQKASFTNAAIYLPNNASIKFRNFADSQPVNLIKSDASDNVAIGGNITSFSAGGVLFGTGSNVGNNYTFRAGGSGGPQGVVLATDLGNVAQSNRLFYQTGSTAFANYVNANGVLVWTYGATPGSSSGTGNMTFGSVGLRVGDGNAATAKIHVATGSSGATSTAPLKLTAGTNLTTPEAGAIEFDGTDLFYTTSTPTRKTVANIAAAQTFTNKTLAVGSNNITGTAGRVAQFNPTTGNLEPGSSAPPIAGSFSGSGTTTTTYTVTIGATMGGTTYKVNATPTNALSAASFYVNNKTTTTFDVVYLSGLTGTVTFDWSVFP